MTAAPLSLCPSCGKPALKRLMGGGAGMIFKGSGFYLTDYRGNSGDEKSVAKPETAKKPSSEQSGTETTPATKTESGGEAGKPTAETKDPPKKS